jgi:hypothetical protein
MAVKLESESAKIDQALFKHLYDSAILKIPDKLRREGTKKNNPDYNKILKTTIELFLSKNGLIKTILEEPHGGAKTLFDNIFKCLKVPDKILPGANIINAPTAKRQKDLFEAT